jgi:Zn-dependent protease with chaperone function
LYYLLGISLTLALLLIVNMGVAIFASALWRLVLRRVRGLTPGTRAQTIFGLRIMPVAAALIFVVAFIIPAYLLHEPDASGEVVSGKLALLALLSSLGVCVALYRVFETWLVTRRLASNWVINSVRIDLDGISVPVFKIEHRFPVIAVIGIFRPRMFVASQVLESLEAEELNAAIAHEYGHLRANDNLKRTILRICRDLLIIPIGKGLDSAWAETVESVADEYAAGTGRSTALDLAAALVKIARIVPANTGPAMPAGAFLIDEQHADVTSRVRRLVCLSENKGFSAGRNVPGFSPASWVWAAAMAILFILPLTDGRCLASTHDAIEGFVRLLQ